MRFEYTALDPLGQLVCGRHDAPSRSALHDHLAGRQLDLLQARRHWLHRPQTLTTSELIGFCQHLAHYLAAGIHLGEALQDLAEHADTPALRALGQGLQHALHGGLPLSQALRHELDANPGTNSDAKNIYVAELIAAGELSGTLPALLQRVAETLQRGENWRQQTRRALLYPCIAGAVALLACLFLLLFLVPQIAGFLAASGQPLPLPSRLLFALSALIQRAWLLLLLLPPSVFLLLAIGLRLYPPLRWHLARWQLTRPPFGRIQQQLHLAQLADLLALLYAAGIPLANALASCAASCRNPALAASLRQIEQAVQHGQSLTQAFALAAQETGFYPVFFLRLMRGGEKTGQLEHSLQHIAERYNAAASASIARLHTLLEPALTLCVGLFLGWVVVATLQPLYALLGKAM